MHPVFKNRAWEFSVPPPWRASDCGHCIELTQPEGVGGMHISSARKIEGLVDDAEVLAKFKGDIPDDTEIQQVCCGDFEGYCAEYVDWHSNSYWKVWLLACRKDLLHVTYTCQRGEEDLESSQASALLETLRSKE